MPVADKLFQDTISDWRKTIDQQLLASVADRSPANLYEPISYVVAGGGKRIRPILLLLACQAVGGDIDRGWPAARAVELLHNFTLVHDDIMDADATRRGRPTLHHQYDESTALLAGDAMLAMSFESLILTDSRNLQRIVATFTEGLTVVCEGQAYDMAFETQTTVPPDAYLQMIGKKTAKLLEVSTSIGAMIGDATDEEIAALGVFANNLGIAFQIQDDLLDITSDEKTTGKTYGSDVRRKKQTYLLIHSLNHASPASRSELNQILERDEMTLSDIQRVQSLFEEIGSVEAAHTAVRTKIQTARESLDILVHSPAKIVLLSFLDYILARKS